MKNVLCIAMLVAVSSAHASAITATSPIKQAMIGNSAGWRLARGKDASTVTLEARPPYVTATNLVLDTAHGLEAYDVAKDGQLSRNDDQRVLRDNGTLEFAPGRLLVIQLPGNVKRVEWTAALKAQIQVVVDGRYVGAKYAPIADVKIPGPRRVTVTTDAGRYTFDVAKGKTGAPIYRVITGL